jgi:L,D-transpeptidase ErfK/SrfK
MNMRRNRRRVTIITAIALGCFLVAQSPVHAEILKPPPKPQEMDAPAVKAHPASTPGSLKTEDLPYSPPRRTYDRDYIGEIRNYTATYEDTMVQIARTYDVGFVELRAANPYLDPWMPGAGKKVIIPSMHLLPRAARQGLVINLAEMRMYAFLKPGQVQTFPLGIGREGLSTPSGTTSIVRKTVGPVWRPTPRMRKEHPELPVQVGPGPDNPMGTHAMYLGWSEYAIHGTDKPFSIGRRASSGCMRMYPENIIELYNMVPVGTAVTVVNQPVKLGWVGNKLYMEAHPTTEQADKMEIDGGLPGYVFTEDDMGAIVAAAGEYARDLNWPLIRQVVRERRGYPVEIFHKPSGAIAQNKTDRDEETVDNVEDSDDSDGGDDKKAELIDVKETKRSFARDSESTPN